MGATFPTRREYIYLVNFISKCWGPPCPSGLQAAVLRPRVHPLVPCFPQDCRILLSVEPTDQGCYPLNNRLFCKPCHVKRSAAGCC